MRTFVGPVFLVLLAILPCTVLAAEVHGVKLLDSVEVEGRQLRLNGVGVRKKSIFKIQVYVAGLYLENTGHDPEKILAADTPRRLELHMTHNATSARIRDEFLE